MVGLLLRKQKKLAQSFNISFRYTDDIISINTTRVGVSLDRIYTKEFDIKDITDNLMLKVTLLLTVRTD
jgi:hypothetical protein